MKRPAASEEEYAPLMEGADDDDDEADDDGPTGGVSESDIPADLRSGGKTIKRPSAKARSQKKPAATKRHEFCEEPIHCAFHCVVSQNPFSFLRPFFTGDQW